MKISAVPNLANLAPAPIDQNTGSAVQNLRSLTMRTNYNTNDPNAHALEAAPPLTLSPNNDQARVDEETRPLSPQFAALAKQRRALQQKERALAEREKAMSQQPGQVDAIPLDRLKSEPLRVLLEAGVTYDDLTNAILNNQQNSEVYALRKDFDSYKEQIQKELTEREAAAEQQALREMGNEARYLVQNSNDFELIRTMGHLPDVTRLIEAHYRKHGELLTVQDACEAIENLLFQDIQRVTGLEKVRSHLTQPVAQPPMQQHRGMRTLTNRDTASVPMTARQRAIAAFNGTLRK